MYGIVFIDNVFFLKMNPVSIHGVFFMIHQMYKCAQAPIG